MLYSQVPKSTAVSFGPSPQLVANTARVETPPITEAVDKIPTNFNDFIFVLYYFLFFINIGFSIKLKLNKAGKYVTQDKINRYKGGF
jgi:hypothetical protein